MSDRIFDDVIPRYLPDHFLVVRDGQHGRSDVVRTTYYPAGVDRGSRSPIRSDIGALRVETTGGDRWFGCDHAYINAELRMVVVGCSSRDEVRRAWAIVSEDRR